MGGRLERWLGWDEVARNGLLRLAVGLKAGENQLRDLMDWLEDIALRDGLAIGALLSGKAILDVETDPRLGRADKLKRIKEQITTVYASRAWHRRKTPFTTNPRDATDAGDSPVGAAGFGRGAAPHRDERCQSRRVQSD